MLRFWLLLILWSSLTVNWSPRSGCTGTVTRTLPFVGVGTNWSRSTAVASMQASGIWLLGKILAYGIPAVIVPPPIAVMAAWHPERWSRAYVSFKFPPNGVSEEK